MNFNIVFKMNRTLYIEDVNTEAEARDKACLHLSQLLNQGVRYFMEIEVTRTDEVK